MRRLVPLACALAFACAGQDEELLIPVAPPCPDAGCGVAGGGGGSGGTAGSTASGGSAGTTGSGGIESDAGCSKGSGTVATLSVVNTSGSVTYQVLWVGYACAEVPYGTVAPGGTYSGQTFVGHVWRVRSIPSGVLIKELVIQPGANQVSVP